MIVLSVLLALCALHVHAQWAIDAMVQADDLLRNGEFGRAVSVCGNFAWIGAPGQSSAYVFSFDTGEKEWLQAQKFSVDDGGDGASNLFGFAVHCRGSIVAVGSPGVANDSTLDFVNVYREKGNRWERVAQIDIPSNIDHFRRFGHAVAVDDPIVVIGAPNDRMAGVGGLVYVHRRDGTTFPREQRISPMVSADGDRFGWALSLERNILVVGAPGSDAGRGAAYVFERGGSSFEQRGRLVAPDGANGDAFGISLTLSGDTIVVGAYHDEESGAVSLVDSGSAHIFTRSDNSWAYEKKLVAPDARSYDYYGWAVAVSGNEIIVGARYDDDDGDKSGSAWSYTYNGSDWVVRGKLTAGNDAEEMQHFGWSVAIDGGVALIGAMGVEGGEGAAFFLSGNFGGVVTNATTTTRVVAAATTTTAVIETTTTVSVRGPTPHPVPTPSTSTSATSTSASTSSSTSTSSSSFTSRSTTTRSTTDSVGDASFVGEDDDTTDNGAFVLVVGGAVGGVGVCALAVVFICCVLRRRRRRHRGTNGAAAAPPRRTGTSRGHSRNASRRASRQYSVVPNTVGPKLPPTPAPAPTGMYVSAPIKPEHYRALEMQPVTDHGAAVYDRLDIQPHSPPHSQYQRGDLNL